MQIYEMTNGIKVGDEVEFTGELMSVDLGPGLLTQVFDGLQNPLPKLAETKSKPAPLSEPFPRDCSHTTSWYRSRLEAVTGP